ncbi:MAG: M1 family metallopeptidase, partial [Bdellovibrionota bacterium]
TAKQELRHYRIQDAFAARDQTFVDHGGPTRESPTTGGPWTPIFTGETEFDALHYRISMSFPRASLVSPTFDGIVEITFKPLTESYQLLSLDSSPANQIKKITLLNQFQELHFRQNGLKLEIDLNRPYGPKDSLTIAIEYHWDADRGRGVYFKSRTGVNDVEAIYTQSEPEISKFWFPTNSHPNDRANFESFISVPEEFTAISNGALSGITTKDGMKTFHWSMAMPQASYLFVATAGKFGVHHENWNGIPVDFYGPSDDMDRVTYSLRDTPDMLTFISSKTGFRFPYEKYAQTVVPQYAWGGMEHTTATTLTDKTIHSPDEDSQFSSNHLLAHELAHQWFGDLVTCKSWDHIWLNEGFASYFDALYQEHRQGRANYLKTMVGVSSWYFMEEDEEARPVVFPFIHSGLDEYFDSRAYAKGSWILHMLRNTLGDDIFFKGIQTYLYRYQGQVVNTEMFRKVMEEVAVKDLYWFFDQWVMKPGYPHFLIDYAWDMHTKEVVLTVKQTQDLNQPGGIPGSTPLFEGPIDVEVAGKLFHINLYGKNAAVPGTEIFRLASEK